MALEKEEWVSAAVAVRMLQKTMGAAAARLWLVKHCQQADEPLARADNVETDESWRSKRHIAADRRLLPTFWDDGLATEGESERSGKGWRVLCYSDWRAGVFSTVTVIGRGPPGRVCARNVHFRRAIVQEPSAQPAPEPGPPAPTRAEWIKSHPELQDMVKSWKAMQAAHGEAAAGTRRQFQRHWPKKGPGPVARE